MARTSPKELARRLRVRTLFESFEQRFSAFIELDWRKPYEPLMAAIAV
jgi:hypothetical protein